MGEEALLAKLDTLIRLQATSMVDRFDTQKERITFLSKAGLQPKEIGDILGVSPNSVSVTLSQIRKKVASDAR